jgi:hypothetical protein
MSSVLALLIDNRLRFTGVSRGDETSTKGEGCAFSKMIAGLGDDGLLPLNWDSCRLV